MSLTDRLNVDWRDRLGWWRVIVLLVYVFPRYTLRVYLSRHIVVETAKLWCWVLGLIVIMCWARETTHWDAVRLSLRVSSSVSLNSLYTLPWLPLSLDAVPSVSARQLHGENFG